MANNNSSRDAFRSRFGFIMSCIGSAVGMGCIWLFPYRVGQYGGFAFLVPFLIFVVGLGFCGVMGEMAFGRAMRTGPVGAFRKATQRRGSKIGGIFGLLPLIGSTGVAIGYTVIVGWILRFLFGAATGGMFATESGAYFGEIAGNFGSIGWHIFAIVLTFVVMNAGISAGIERANKIVMPLFFFLFVGLAIFVATIPGSEAGYEFLFSPDWSALADPKTWMYALGQAFFSLSLAGCGTIVYGSYLKKDIDVVGCARNVAFFDTCAALLAGMVVIPAVFAFGLDVGSGPPLMFITLPVVFQQLPMGNVFAAIFFVAAIFAAVTSLMNLFETPIEALQQELKLSRGKAVGLIALIAALVGIFIESGDAVGAWMDAVSIYIVPLGALIAAVMFFWVCPRGYAREQVQTGRDKTLGGWFEPVTRYLFVGITFIVYVLGIFFGGIG